MNNKKIVLILTGVLLFGCGIFPWRGYVPMNNGRDWSSLGGFSSNGERIYLTATNERGEYIQYTGGPGTGGMMMGGNLNCAACHGSDGRGGVHTMHMDVMDAPDIRYSALGDEAGEHGAESEDSDTHTDETQNTEESDSHTDELSSEHANYTLEDFRKAVVSGQHPDGNSLKRDMPSWQLNDDDLADLFDYLKMLP